MNLGDLLRRLWRRDRSELGAAATPKFSVIVVDYEGSVSRKRFRRAMRYLSRQTFRNFEVLVYHDGPKATSYEADLGQVPPPPGLRFFVTGERENNWGHSNRNRGIHAAKGDYIVHLNADNVLYDDALEEIAALIDGPLPAAYGVPREPQQPRFRKEKRIVVFAIMLKGRVQVGGKLIRLAADDPRYGRYQSVLGGVPVKRGRIDAMQFVMQRRLWLEAGGWTDLRWDGDGRQYQKLARRHGVVCLPKILGEHW